MDAIWTFTGPYRFLSNFFIEPDGSCVEVEFQAMKCANPMDIFKFQGLGPADAKRLGRRVQLRRDWEDVKLEVMFTLVYKKFDDHPSLSRQLDATGKALLEEGNTWGDTYWGVCEGIGQNHLGKILMRVRLDLIPF